MNSLRDEQQLVEAVCQLPRPEFVADVELYTDLDSSGDPALRVWVIVKDADFAPAQQADALSAFAKQIRQATWEIDERYWPYIRFRTVSEQAALNASRQKKVRGT